MNGDAQRFKALLQEVRARLRSISLSLVPRGQIFVPTVCVTYTPDAQQLLQEYFPYRCAGDLTVPSQLLRLGIIRASVRPVVSH